MDNSPAFEIRNQGGVNAGNKFGNCPEALIGKLGANQLDQFLHLGMPQMIFGAFDKNQPMLMKFGCQAKFPMGRR